MNQRGPHAGGLLRHDLRGRGVDRKCLLALTFGAIHISEGGGVHDELRRLGRDATRQGGCVHEVQVLIVHGRDRAQGRERSAQFPAKLPVLAEEQYVHNSSLASRCR